MALKPISQPRPEIEQIRTFCKKNSVPYTSLAAATGISYSAVCQYLSGKFLCPQAKIDAMLDTIKRFKAIASEHGTPIKVASKAVAIAEQFKDTQAKHKTPACKAVAPNDQSRLHVIEQDISRIKHALAECRGTMQHNAAKVAKLDSCLDETRNKLNQLESDIVNITNRLTALMNFKRDYITYSLFLEKEVKRKLDYFWFIPIIAIGIGLAAISLTVYHRFFC